MGSAIGAFPELPHRGIPLLVEFAERGAVVRRNLNHSAFPQVVYQVRHLPADPRRLIEGRQRHFALYFGCRAHSSESSVTVTGTGTWAPHFEIKSSAKNGNSDLHDS